jgi:predicted N-acyltransferase
MRITRSDMRNAFKDLRRWLRTERRFLKTSGIEYMNLEGRVPTVREQKAVIFFYMM